MKALILIAALISSLTATYFSASDIKAEAQAKYDITRNY